MSKIHPVINLFFFLKKRKPLFKGFTRRQRFIVLFCLFLILIPVVLYTFIFRKDPQAAWWNDQWSYRQRIDVTNSSGSTLTNQRVKIIVNTSSLISAGKLQTNCNDIRVTDVNGKILDHWDTDCNSTSTSVFVKVPALPSSSILYLYYGNASVGNAEKLLGTTENPGTSCLMMKNQGSVTGNGVNYIVPGGSDNDLLKVYCDQTTDGGGWALVMNQNATTGGFYANNSEALNYNEADPTTARYSILNKLSKFKDNGVFTFKLNWPGDSKRNIWSQTSNPISESIAGYSAITIDDAGCGWGGLAQSDDVGTTLLDGSPNSGPSSWWFAVASMYNYSGGIPGSCGYVASHTQLWVKGNDTMNNTATIVDSTVELSPAPVVYYSLDEGNGLIANNSNWKKTGTTTNLAINSSFEDGSGTTPNSWITYSNGASCSGVVNERVIDTSMFGSYIMHTSSPDGCSSGYYLTGIPISPNTTYTLSYIYKTTGSAVAGTYLYGSSGNAWGTTKPSSANWARFEYSFTSGASDTSIMVYIRKDYGGVGELYADAIQLEQSSSFTNYCDGSIIGNGSHVWNGTAHASSSTCSYGTDGQIVGATWKPESDCVSGKCLYFDGQTSPVRTITNNVLHPDTFTISMWIKPNQYSGNANVGYILADNYGGSVDWIFYLSNTGLLALRPHPGNDWKGNSTIPLNEWTHVAATYDGSTVSLYVNGKYDGGGSSTGMTHGTGHLSIGGHWEAGWENTWIKGFIDEVKVYPYTRTAGQIKEDYNLGKAHSGVDKGAGVTLGANKDSSDALSNGLVGYWKMDEVSWNGTTGEVKDSSGMTKDGTASGGATTTAGKFGNSGFFDNIDNIVLNNSGGYLPSGSSARTLTFWFKPGAGMVSTNIAVGYGCNSGEGYGCAAGAAGLYVGAWATQTEIGIHLESCAVVGPSVPSSSTGWHFYTAVFNGNNTITYYIDGGSSTTVTPGCTINTNTGNGFSIGGGRWGYYNGNLDEIRIYNRALSPAEVTQLYNWAPGPVAHWKLDEKSGSQINDSSGLNNNSTLWGGDPVWVTGKYGSGLEFDGDDYVEISHNTNFDVRALTIESWIKTPASMGGTLYRALFSKQGAERDFNWYTYSNEGTKVTTFHFSSARFGSHAYALPTAFEPNTWHHVAFTQDDNGHFDYYADGVSYYSGTGTVGYANSNYPIWISRADNYWTGAQDDIRFYNYARTQKQIVEDMNASHPTGGSPVGSQVAYWPFDEGYGTSTKNSILSSYTADFYNGVAWSNNGMLNKALRFDGNTDQVIVQGSSGLKYMGDDLTISMWINPDADDDGGGLITKPWNGSGEYNYRIDSYGGANPHFNFMLYGATPYQLDSVKTITAGQWHHIAVTVEGSSKLVKFYLDGILANSGTHSISGWTPPAGADTINLGFGCIYPYGSDYCVGTTAAAYKGLIDEVKLYNSLLNPEEIKIEYNLGSAIVLGSGTENGGNSPIAEWKFDEKANSTANDTSGNGVTATLEGASWLSSGSCKEGSCVEFDGVNDYVNTNYSGGNKSTWTMEGWIYDTAPTEGYRSIIQVNTVDDDALYIYPNNNYIGFWPCGAVPAAVSQNTWHYFAASYNNSTGFVYYLDGKQVGTTGICADATDWDFFRIGGTGTNDTERWKGRMDHIKVYDYVRTPAQIAYDYNRGGPIAKWDFDECQGTTIHDTSGNAYNGTWNGSGGGTQTSVGTCTTAGTAWGNGASGKYSSSLNFDGTDDKLSIGQLGYALTNFSIAFWAKANGLPVRDYDRLFDSQDAIDIAVDHSGNVRYYDGTWTDVSTLIPADGFTHFVFTFDGTNFVVYKNSKQVYSAQRGRQISNNFLAIAGKFNDSGYPEAWPGQIDDYRIYNYPLTADQVKTVMNEGSAIRYGK